MNASEVDLKGNRQLDLAYPMSLTVHLSYPDLHAEFATLSCKTTNVPERTSRVCPMCESFSACILRKQELRQTTAGAYQLDGISFVVYPFMCDYNNAACQRMQGQKKEAKRLLDRANKEKDALFPDSSQPAQQSNFSAEFQVLLADKSVNTAAQMSALYSPPEDELLPFVMRTTVRENNASKADADKREVGINQKLHITEEFHHHIYIHPRIAHKLGLPRGTRPHNCGLTVTA